MSFDASDGPVPILFVCFFCLEDYSDYEDNRELICPFCGRTTEFNASESQEEHSVSGNDSDVNNENLPLTESTMGGGRNV